MASLNLGKVTPGPGMQMNAGYGSLHRPRVKPRPDGTYGRDPRWGTPINTEEQAQELMDPRTPGGRQLQDWAEGKARQNWEAMIPEFRKRMMRNM